MIIPEMAGDKVQTELVGQAVNRRGAVKVVLNAGKLAVPFSSTVFLEHPFKGLVLNQVSSGPSEWLQTSVLEASTEFSKHQEVFVIPGRHLLPGPYITVPLGSVTGTCTKLSYC